MKYNIKIILILSASIFLISTCSSSHKEGDEHQHEGKDNHGKKEGKHEESHDHEEGEEHGSDIELTLAQYEQAAITLVNPAKRSIGASLSVNGKIEVPPKGDVSINIPYGGFLKSTEMLPGTVVRKGQLLATIENPDFIKIQQAYLENIAQQEFLEIEYQRQKELYEGQVSSAKKYQQAKTDYLSNKARTNSLVEQLKMIGINLKRLATGKISSQVNVYSPINGLVRDVYANIGRYLEPKDVIMDLTNTEDLHVELTVYENDIPKVKKGQKIYFTVGNDPSKIREAEIFLVGSNVREDRSVTVHGHLMREDPQLLPGMYISASIITDSKQQKWTVQEEAIVLYNSKNYLFVYEGEKVENEKKIKVFEMKEVAVGQSERGFVQVSFADGETLSKELQIAHNGAYSLLAKSKNTSEGHAH